MCKVQIKNRRRINKWRKQVLGRIEILEIPSG
jgi:hypothetical protein